MAQSQYYGSRGGNVKDMQNKLNSYGASLKVDGIWGPKTEAAYQKHGLAGDTLKTKPMDAIDAFRQGGLNIPEGVKLQSEPAIDESTFKKEAEDRYNPYYDKAGERLMEYYAQALAEAADGAISRGMARSTYFDEMQNSLRSRRASELSENERSRASQIAEAIAGLRSQAQEQIRMVQEYNNRLLMQLYELEQQRLKALAASKSGGRSGRKSSAKKDEKSEAMAPKAKSMSQTAQLGSWAASAGKTNMQQQLANWLGAFNY
ncbi:MAG: peptidoglycan-binding domain-containing protein [Christensenellales bacterium]|jgi:peptidoglycan hydrolase-like protein with peptidoglycan-binding domain